MYKVTIRRRIDVLEKEVIIETDDVELIKQILVAEEVLKVETDVPNESIDPGMLDLQDFWKKQIEDMAKRPPADPLKPYRDSADWPFTTPFTVTC